LRIVPESNRFFVMLIEPSVRGVKRHVLDIPGFTSGRDVFA
jgi:hypothetical protein